MGGAGYHLDPQRLSLEPSNFSAASPSTSVAELEQGQKKKRKAWGQPIPDFKVVLPPRKRARTSEEKEQRKNERVIRNRRAADKSRQRQKAAVAELETSKTLMEQENAALRKALAKYQATFGELPGVQLPALLLSPQINATDQAFITTPATAPTPISMQPSPHPSTSIESMSTAPSPVPTLLLDSPIILQSMRRSTSFTPSLFPAQEQQYTAPEDREQSLLSLPNFREVPDVTQYPAAMLCDLQCQSETSMDLSKQTEVALRFNLSLQLINLTILTTLYETFSSKMISPMIQIFRILAANWVTSSLSPDWMDKHFPLIQCLISTPTSTTSRRIFRTKLLSRLLACSPSMARLLEAATDRALQRVVDDGFVSTDPRRVRQWASLLTIKWAIQWVEREHQRHRLMVDSTSGLGQGLSGLAAGFVSGRVAGVDYAAVEKNSWRWLRCTEGLDGTLGGHCVPGLGVY